MKEELIGFEVAKLAKEKGFNITNKNSYDENTGLMLPLDTYGHCYLLEGTFPAPTQSLLQRWLRERFKILIELSWSDNHNMDCYQPVVRRGFKKYKLKQFHIYEDALEFGLLEALKLI